MSVPDTLQQQLQPPHIPALNCIVDESALLTGLTENPKNNLQHWVVAGFVNVFVPLYTLEQLGRLRDENGSSAQDARAVLAWLDRSTSATENKVHGRVELQGPEDQYNGWHEVERFLLPETPLSTFDGNDIDGISDDLDSLELNDNECHSLSPRNASSITNFKTGSTFSMNPASPSFTPSKPYIPSASTNGTNMNGDKTAQRDSRNLSRGLIARPHSRNGSATGIPAQVQPLLNFVVWRTYNPDLAARDGGRNILLTNNINTQKQAQKFGVRAKLISQLRTIVAREEKRAGINLESIPIEPISMASDVTTGGSISDIEGDDGGDEVVFNPNERPTSSRSGPKIWDPNHFGRSQPSRVTNSATPLSPEPTKRAVVTVSPGKRGGKGGSQRGKSNGRGRSTKSSRGRGQAVLAPQPKHQVTQPIDPDSYARPAPTGGKRGRGTASRRLWDPS